MSEILEPAYPKFFVELNELAYPLATSVEDPNGETSTPIYKTIVVYEKEGSLYENITNKKINKTKVTKKTPLV